MSAGKAIKIAGWVLLGIAIAVVLAFLLGLAVMALWNWLLPAITRGAVAEITYWQAVGLFILCHLLFKSHHEHHGGEHDHHKNHGAFARKIHGLIGGKHCTEGEKGPEESA
jgi:hypothetical protein